MKRALFILMAALACCGSISAQYESHWLYDFNLNQFQFNQPVVAFVKINGEYITTDYYENLEVAAFVGEECRGHAFMSDRTDFGDPYPIVEMNVYYDNPGETVTFRLWDHNSDPEFGYNLCTSNMEILTGEAYVALYSDYDIDALVLNFEFPTDITLKDNENNSRTLATYQGKLANITISGRTIYEGRWNTLCLPFYLDKDQLADSPLAGFDVMELTGTAFDGSVTGYESATKTLRLNFKQVEDIVAGVPYLIRKVKTADGIGDIVDPTFENVYIVLIGHNPDDCKFESKDKTVAFLGTYDPVEFSSEERSVLFLQNNNLYYPDGDESTTIGAFRAYFPLNGIHGGNLPSEGGSHPVRSFVLNFGDESTAVEMVNDEIIDGKSDDWYDVSGRKLNQKPAQRGIYLNNGRKVLVNDNK